MKNVFIYFSILLLLVHCGPETRSGWIEMPVPDKFGEDSGEVYLQVYGQNLSSGLEEAVITYNTIQDLISGGEKTIFTISLNGKTSSNDLVVITPDGQEFVFHCYDGIIFNIDNESNDIERMIKLMEQEELKFRQDNLEFTIKTNGFNNEHYNSIKATF